MSDENRGVYRKYQIRRADGSSGPGGKHEKCIYFVLDLDHDPFAMPALEAYAAACEETHPKLAKDIRAALAAEAAPPCGCRSVGECSCGPRTASEAVEVQMWRDKLLCGRSEESLAESFDVKERGVDHG